MTVLAPPNATLVRNGASGAKNLRTRQIFRGVVVISGLVSVVRRRQDTMVHQKMFFVAVIVLILDVTAQNSISAAKKVPGNEIIVDIAGVGHIRVQALSDTLLRFELPKSDGSFEDRQTFMVQNRSFKGVPIKHRQPPGPSGVVLSTSGYTIQLRSPTWLSSPSPSSCRNPLVGYAPASPMTAEIVGVVASATSAASCCGACDAMGACEAWLFDSQIPKPHAGLTLRHCDGSLGQIWSFKADGSITAMHSAAKGPGCWQVCVYSFM